MRQALTQMSNQATLDQLQDMMSESETDVSTRVDDLTSDAESRFSEALEQQAFVSHEIEIARPEVLLEQSLPLSNQISREKSLDERNRIPNGDVIHSRTGAEYEDMSMSDSDARVPDNIADMERIVQVNVVQSESQPSQHAPPGTAKTTSVSSTSDNEDTANKHPSVQLDRNSNITAMDQDSTPMTSDSEIEEIVRRRMIEKEWEMVESRKSPIISTSPEFATLIELPSTDSSERTNSTLLNQSSLWSPVERLHNNVAHPDIVVDEAEQELPDDEDALPEFAADDEYFSSAEGRRVPLPSFDETPSRLGFSEVDLDDISHHSNEDDEHLTSLETEITFASTWSGIGSSLFSDRSIISAYDNYGEKKVGRDVQGPVMMFVPDTGEKNSHPKVGGR